jgi:hypothetical protein
MVKLIFEPLIENSEDDKVKIKVVYTRKEWENLKQLYESWGLELYHTNRLFDKYEADVYRYRGNIEHLRERVIRAIYYRSSVPDQDYNYIRDNVVDNINKPLIVNYLINLAIFRVMPQSCDNRHCYTEFVEDADLIYLPFTRYLREIFMVIHALANKIDLSGKKIIVYVRMVDQ